jgi:SagB-type dehydrogenase family enzyme
LAAPVLRAASSRLRRARTLFAYWEQGRLCFQNFAARETIEAAPLVCELLDFFGRWRKRDEAVARFKDYTAASIRSAVEELLGYRLLLRQGSAAAAQDSRIAEEWSPWFPAASFHFATKDAPYVDRSRWSIARRRKLVSRKAKPANVVRVAHRGKIALKPRRFTETEFVRVLTARRTHWRFANESVSVENISELLALVWGVTGYADSPLFGRSFLKTSPSGGARHPGEVYLMALRVSGLAPGLYHYQPARHELERIATGADPEQASRYCAGQRFVKRAAALFFMTAVFPRTMWKYSDPRAYRVVLLETGHLCQTFCLVATWLGLAPFCTAALRDTLIERDLKIDGIRESVLYVSGIGARPCNYRGLSEVTIASNCGSPRNPSQNGCSLSRP